MSKGTKSEANIEKEKYKEKADIQGFIPITVITTETATIARNNFLGSVVFSAQD